MVTRTIHTEQYDVDLGRLLARRLEQCGADCVLEQTGNAATICVPDDETFRIQELHLPVYHMLCIAAENEFFGD